MCRVSGGKSLAVLAGSTVAGVMEACVTLLVTLPPGQHTTTPLEATTLALAGHHPDLLHTLVSNLLTHPLLMQHSGNL